jgi:DNA-binding transcriptional MerR regulator
MRIGELARRVHVNPKTVRYYESIGLLPAPERTESGYRVYAAADEELLAFIKAAQRLGMRLDEIREIIALRERGQAPCDYVRQMLRREVADIEHRIGELERLREELAALDAYADELSDTAAATSNACCPLIDHDHQRVGELSAGMHERGISVDETHGSAGAAACARHRRRCRPSAVHPGAGSACLEDAAWGGGAR